ncbi:PadR family transcriptional regulator [Streptomyces sp. MCAF7]
MSAIRLMVLGAVRQHGRAHGYQVRNDLEFWGAHEWSNAKPGSIYHALKQMAKQGLMVAHDVAPSTAGGPPRTEYELTDAGEEAADSGAQWTRGLIERLEGGAYVMAGEGKRSVDVLMDSVESAVGAEGPCAPPSGEGDTEAGRRAPGST